MLHPMVDGTPKKEEKKEEGNGESSGAKRKDGEHIAREQIQGGVTSIEWKILQGIESLLTYSDIYRHSMFD